MHNKVAACIPRLQTEVDSKPALKVNVKKTGWVAKKRLWAATLAFNIFVKLSAATGAATCRPAGRGRR